MSVKRQASNQLTQENWDQEDPTEQEDGTGGFKIAPKDVLEKRVIRVAKRRTQTGEAKNSVFSGFTGFNKTQPASFDFLAKLTNGSNTNNVSAVKNETMSKSNNLTTTTTSTPSIGIGNLSGTSTPLAKTTFGKSATETPMFGAATTSPGFTQSVFTASKPSTTAIENSFKIQPIQIQNQNADSTTTTTPKLNTSIEKATSQVPANIFGSSPVASSTKSLFSTSSNNSSPFKAQPVSTFQTSDINKSPNTSITSINLSPFNQQPVTSIQPSETTKPTNKSDVQDDKKLLYYNKLKGLNESVSSWIKKHVEETPLCILTPIFRDYEKHLKEIQDEFQKSKEKLTLEPTSDNKQNNTDIKPTSASWPTSKGSSLFSTSSNNMFSNNKNSILTSNNSPEKSSNFVMGINTSSNTSTANFSTSPTNTGFSFGIKPSSGSPSFGEKSTNANPSLGEKTSIANTLFGIQTSSTTSSPFALNVATTNSNGSTPFSFGIVKPFSLNSNVQKTEEPSKEGEENEDEPPKVEYTPIVEENSVYDKKCKVFVKKDGNFIDKGVGTLYIKKVENNEKYQLLVRANTTLGNVLLNLILGSSVPTQRMGKNNVMMVCIPTPDAKPPPTSILIRVKTSEEADELLETLNKYKA